MRLLSGVALGQASAWVGGLLIRDVVVVMLAGCLLVRREQRLDADLRRLQAQVESLQEERAEMSQQTLELQLQVRQLRDQLQVRPVPPPRHPHPAPIPCLSPAAFRRLRGSGCAVTFCLQSASFLVVLSQRTFQSLHL